MIIFETRKFKYFTNDLFNPDEFIEISEDDFNSQVVKYRSLFKMSYDENMNRIFTNITNEYNIYKVVTI